MEDLLTEITKNAPTCIAIAIVLLTVIYYFVKNRGLPPGPTGLPYLGYWPFLRNDSCHLQLQELVKKYGDVFSFTSTGRLYINLGSLKVNREAAITKSDYFAKRVEDFSVISHVFKDGIICLNGEAWKEIRKFFTQQFRDRGMTTFKTEMCGPVYETIDRTIEELRETKGKSLDIVELLTRKCNKVLCQTAFGEECVTQEEIAKISEAFGALLASIAGPSFFIAGTFARYFILPFSTRYQTALKNLSVMENTLNKIISRQKETFDADNVRNIIDAFFKEKQERLSRNDPTAKYFTDRALVSTFLQIVGDGVISVAAYISMFFKALLDHPEEQDKIYKELMDVIGLERNPSMDDKSKLPYTSAFISEVTRTSAAFPFFPRMECTREVTIGGYRIPKNAITVMDHWSSNFDPKVYEDPQKFNPSRFLVKEGNRKPDQPVLFGMGKRTCIGEPYTMSQVFLFLTTIVKHFHLSKPKDANESLLFLIGQLHICVEPRKEG